MLDEARRFALAMHGAALLYNVLLTERAAEIGLTEHESRRDAFTASLEEWGREIEASDLRGWNLDRLWALAAEQGRPVSRAYALVRERLARPGAATVERPGARRR